ncbi:hypothetical protein [Streptomyces venezuelae]|uniref:hypothetical protein n=1 Tax=Streptomyces venezuelae TaxID=54571 RepID=UPI0034135E2D
MSKTSAPDLLRDVRRALEAAGVRHVFDAEVWLGSSNEVLCKVTVAPEERQGAAAVPVHLAQALHAAGYALALTSDSAVPDCSSPEAALGVGHAVRVAHG